MKQLELPFRRFVDSPEELYKILKEMGFYAGVTKNVGFKAVKSVMEEYQIYICDDRKRYDLQNFGKKESRTEIIPVDKLPMKWRWTWGPRYNSFGGEENGWNS